MNMSVLFSDCEFDKQDDMSQAQRRMLQFRWENAVIIEDGDYMANLLVRDVADVSALLEQQEEYPLDRMPLLLSSMIRHKMRMQGYIGKIVKQLDKEPKEVVECEDFVDRWVAALVQAEEFIDAEMQRYNVLAMGEPEIPEHNGQCAEAPQEAADPEAIPS